MKALPTPNTASPDTIRSMSLDLLFDYMGVRLNGPKANGKELAINWKFTDTKQQYVMFLENSALNHTPDKQRADADLTITLTRETMNDILLGQAKIDDSIASGKVKLDGEKAVLDELLSLLDSFEFWFDIVTPN